MERCAICGKPREDLESITVYTAQLLDQTSEKTGFKEYTTTMTYGGFKQHTYEVCNTCLMRKGCIVPLIVYGVSALLLVFLFIIMNNTSVGGAILAALLAAFLPAGLVALKFDAVRILTQKALAARKREKPFFKYKGYTAQQYEALNQR